MSIRSDRQEDRAGQVFLALGDPTRRKVLRELSRTPATSTELARTLPVTRQAIHKHLAVLAQCGLVAADRTGRDVRYRLDGDPLRAAASWLEATAQAWDRRLADLKLRAESDEG